MRTVSSITSALTLALVAGCSASGRTTPAARSDANAPALAPVLAEAELATARDVRVFAGDSGGPVTWTSLVSSVTGADAAIIGENHGHRRGLATAAALWADVVAQRPTAALSFEFFERDDQARLDDYIGGLIDEAAFVRRTGRTPANHPAGHRTMLEAARQNHRRVLAANSPRVYARLARTEDFARLEGLTLEQRALFVIPPELPTGRYREDFFREMAGAVSHGAAGGSTAPDKSAATAPADPAAEQRALEGFLRAQSLWDWTMADTIASAIEDGHQPVLHVVGRFHADFGGGLVQALRVLRPEARIVTVSMADAWAEALRDDDRGRADFVVYVGPGEAGSGKP